MNKHVHFECGVCNNSCVMMEGYKIIGLKVSMNNMRGIMRVSGMVNKQVRRSGVSKVKVSEGV